MQSEVTKLIALLRYTIEHNKKHTEELGDLAQKAKELGKAIVYDDIVKGIEQMNSANGSLGNALKNLGG